MNYHRGAVTSCHNEASRASVLAGPDRFHRVTWELLKEATCHKRIQHPAAITVITLIVANGMHPVVSLHSIIYLFVWRYASYSLKLIQGYATSNVLRLRVRRTSPRTSRRTSSKEWECLSEAENNRCLKSFSSTRS